MDASPKADAVGVGESIMGVYAGATMKRNTTQCNLRRKTPTEKATMTSRRFMTVRNAGDVKKSAS